MSHRKASMTMADLEAIHENRAAIVVPTVRDENEEIFEEICEEVERDDSDSYHSSTISTTKKASRDDDDLLEHQQQQQQQLNASPFIKQQRRHSTYESRMRRTHRQAHSEFKDFFQTLDDHHAVRRASFVNNLLEFNLSVDVSMSSMSDINSHNNAPTRSAAMHLSCPVLSYLNDEEEDSVELRLMKRPDMTYVGDDSLDQSWESLKDDTTNAAADEPSTGRREYVIELPPLDAMDDTSSSSRPRRRKRHSYKILESQLNEFSHKQVLKNFNNSSSSTKAQSKSQVALPPAVAKMPTSSVKNLDDSSSESYASQHQANEMKPSRAAMARGA